MKYLSPLSILSERSTEPELMDSSTCDITLLHKTLEQFALLNTLFSASRHFINKYFFPIMMSNPAKEYSLLDIGCGACDIDIWIIREARKRNISIKITALDYDHRVLPVANKMIHNFPEIALLQGDAKDLSGLGMYDFIFSNHMLHHLSWQEIQQVIEQALQHCNIAFCFNDLERNILAYYGYTVFTGLFLQKSLAFYDGRLSIKKGFRFRELQEFVEKNFGESGIKVERGWPFRLALVNGLQA